MFDCLNVSQLLRKVTKKEIHLFTFARKSSNIFGFLLT